MICADTNCWIAYFLGEPGRDIDLLQECISHRAVVMSPVVLAELLSDPSLPVQEQDDLLVIPMMEITPGYWFRSGKLRAELYRLKYRPKLVDTLIAQNCIDHHVPLLTRDRDFRLFVRHGGLALA